jgi:two-component system sensor histidine kinase/response regulator
VNAGPVKFLLVDDTEENLVALEALLRRDGLELLRAHSGSEALELLLEHDVALALVDVQMPEMDGFELAELMRGSRRTQHVPIIFVTAGAHSPQRVFKGYETGAVDFLFKPIEPHVLKGKADVFFELYRQRKELESSLRLNEMFVGILGHDLRNPLGAIVLGAQLLERQLAEQQQLRTVQRITAAGQRMTNMIEQLLDLTRARLAGGLGLVRAQKRIDTAALVQRTVEELRGARPEREIVVDVRGDCGTRGDPDRLLQLFSNLVANAIHHGLPGTPVNVTVDGGSHEIWVRVHNLGVIPADLLPTIFDPFRSRPAAGSKSSGLGLGLYISQQIARAHGGDIAVESRQPLGTSFNVRLPRAEKIDPGRGAGRRKLLIVDDDQHSVDSLREVFQEEGYEVATAGSGEEALEILHGEKPFRPDVLILDLVLPGMDGVHVYASLQADPVLSRVPVIVATSNPTRAPAGTIVAAKPLKLDRLLETVAGLWN